MVLRRTCVEDDLTQRTGEGDEADPGPLSKPHQDMGRPTKELDTSTYAGRVAAAIRGRRTKKKLTVEQAALKADVPEQTWYNWENGRHSPHLNQLPAIAKTLGCSIRTLLPPA